MQLAIIINSFACVIGAILGALLAAGSLINIANAKVRWAGRLVVAALLIPVNFLVAGFGAWLAHANGANEVAIGLIAFPWVYGLFFVGAMVVALRA